MEDVAIDPESATCEPKLAGDVANEATKVHYKVSKAQIVCLLSIELQKCSNRKQKGFKNNALYILNTWEQVSWTAEVTV